MLSMNKLPPLIDDFLRSVTPDPDKGPVRELQDRYDDRRREQQRAVNGNLPFNLPHNSPEFMVEMRIRDWVRRMEAERAELERIRKENAAPPHKKPPAP
ncbi:MAG: hypothetical protein EPN97_05490 [Alphaproteobacteria bacterium]|nr:MAG: hypothetical protein EPN97_05490 [Alphaproteobacteria bacterium]